MLRFLVMVFSNIALSFSLAAGLGMTSTHRQLRIVPVLHLFPREQSP
jgi:hypothetical protein